MWWFMRRFIWLGNGGEKTKMETKDLIDITEELIRRWEEKDSIRRDRERAEEVFEEMIKEEEENDI